MNTILIGVVVAVIVLFLFGRSLPAVNRGSFVLALAIVGVLVLVAFSGALGK